jgi:hypothetical protein
MSNQVDEYFWTKIKENYHINDSKFSSSHSEKVFSYTWLLSNSLDQSGHQHTIQLDRYNFYSTQASGCVLRIYTRTHDLACAQMKFHKHMRDMRDLLRFKTYFQFNITF